MLNFSKINKIYFIGIGGIMMSAVAKYFLDLGKEVSGSDRDQSEITDKLIKQGVKVSLAQAAKNVNENFDLVVYTQAIGMDNPELLKAKELGLPIYSVFEVLGFLSKNKFTIAVSGIHGKSSSTAILGLVMEAGDLDPTVFVGTQVKEFEGNFRAGSSEYLLSEACEYKDNFLEYWPDIGVITNIEAEHLDYFGNLDGIMKSFSKFVSQIKEDGWLVVNGDNQNAVKALEGYKGKKISFGLGEGVDFRGVDIKYGEKTEFKLESSNDEYDGKKFQLNILGEFNVYNALGVMAVAAVLGIKVGVVRKVLENFEGVWRRFEFKGVKDGIEYYDDYGHHPTEIKATLEAAKKKFGDKKLWLVYQPHLYSRTNDFMDEFAESLNLAPNLILASIYPAREENKWGIES